MMAPYQSLNPRELMYYKHNNKQPYVTNTYRKIHPFYYALHPSMLQQAIPYFLLPGLSALERCVVTLEEGMLPRLSHGHPI